MIKYNSELLQKDLRLKRIIDFKLSLEKCSKLIGISKPTLSRIENGSLPDLMTFFKIIKWLDSDARIYINY
jgi:transcriptional regulator with XRE-family HTH domain